MKVTLTVNGQAHDADVEPRTLLAELLRDQLGLTGTHIGCDTSQCGCCTVHVDGQAVKSCTMLAVQAEGCKVTTIEGLASLGRAGSGGVAAGGAGGAGGANGSGGAGVADAFNSQIDFTTGNRVPTMAALHPVQQAFSACHGLQCGFCTPGMIMATVDLLKRHPDPDDEQIKEGLAGNLCRCTGYVNIIAAVKQAARLMRSAA